MRVVLGVVLLALVSAASVAASGKPASCAWRVVLDRPGAQLTAVSAVSDDNVWAVGSALDRGAILHWDGTGWWPSPASILPIDVAATSARDVWIVGSSAPTAPVLSRAETQHWDGRRWAVVPVPAGPGSYLGGISIRPSGVWAVGAGVVGPLAVHWTGRVWRSASTLPADGLLHAVNGIWAVGTRGQSSASRVGSEDPLVERWAGGRWRIVRTPSFNAVGENLQDVAPVATGDVWAVGWADIIGGRTPLIQHLVGHIWRDESVEGLPQNKAALLSVVALGKDDLWTAGYQGFTPQRTLLAHWDGKTWTQVPSLRGGALSDLSALSAHDIWAVGGSPGRSLIEHYSCTS